MRGSYYLVSGFEAGGVPVFSLQPSVGGGADIYSNEALPPADVQSKYIVYIAAGERIMGNVYCRKHACVCACMLHVIVLCSAKIKLGYVMSRSGPLNSVLCVCFTPYSFATFCV